MIILRLSHTRGYADHGWLKSFHSFSFAQYYAPEHNNFGNLRVINEDIIAAGSGFATHPHHNMEIITYVLSGHLFHQDSMGNSSTIEAGDIQRMTAGTGVTHSEYSHSSMQTHLLQIWITPNQLGLSPSYEQAHILQTDKYNQLLLIASPNAEKNSIKINADARIYTVLFDQPNSIELILNPQRKYYVFLIKGSVHLNTMYILHTGDAALMSNESLLCLTHSNKAEALIFDLSP